MTDLNHKSERKECEKELKVMPGRWRVARKNDRYEFRLSIVPGKHFLVIQYRQVKPVGSVLFEAMAEYPSLEAAVMRAELEGDMHTPWDSFYLSTLRNAVRILGGG